tara:strand:+ start:6912 stop:10661 length:3750 start_codon:yes stop_codon:yes gene_type:complete
LINRAELLKNLQTLLPHIEKDILAYSEFREDLTAHLKDEYNKAREAGRTAEHFVAWREAQITQAAVAWVLSCVFVRFLEDNGLLTEPLLSGPTSRGAGPVGREQGDKRLDHAKQRMVAYYNENPTHEDREYLFSLFEQLEKYPVIAELLDHKHNPLWQIPVSADGAKRLIDFFQKIDAATGEIVHDFTDSDWDTRFLGDLYQDLSEAVRKRYALLQTPEFVESFILDYTLEKAKETFGLPGLRLIDPTCGSGHFLLTTFERVFEDWLKREPATNTRELAQRALDVVHGVDINPYAIAICRFRLLISAMKAAGTNKVKDAPDFHFNLACGDSLLHGRRFEWQGQGQQTDLVDEDPVKHVLEVEDKEKLLKILGQQYHAVVGNPPYITASDKALNAAYRDRYLTCHKKYSLGVPFTERFFDLTLKAKDGRPAGFVGMITTNSFMKREFGIKLIREYLPLRDLTYVIDTSGAEIPGHGTPTVILFARNQTPVSPTVRAVLGIRGEPTALLDASEGKVWNSIESLLEKPGSENNFVSVVDVDRSIFSSHPWSLEGGGAGDAKDVIESNCKLSLSDFTSEVGFGGITGEDDLFTGKLTKFDSLTLSSAALRTFVYGEVVRNWAVFSPEKILFPYERSSINATFDESLCKKIWPGRVNLRNRVYFGKTQDQRGLAWYEYGYISKDKCAADFLIAFPFVSTHNHFVIDRGGKVFNRTAPVIKLPNGTSQADHLVLLGLLNSSVACFWGRQVFFPKGGFADGKWEERLEWDGTKLKRFPISGALDASVQDESRLLPGYQSIESLSQQIDTLAQELASQLPEASILTMGERPVAEVLAQAKRQTKHLRSQMVALQEELDWLCYQAYGLLDEALVYHGELPLVQAGERAFEILLARELAANGGSDAWFTRHDLVQTTYIPDHWPDDYKLLIEKRLAVMQSNRFIKLIEKPEYKRRWLPLEWQKQEAEALRNWLLSFLEKQCFDNAQPMLTTCAKLADSINRDVLAKTIAQRYTGNDLFEAQPLVEKLVAGEHIPQAAASRLKPASMKKYRAWQETWNKQRQEDAIDAEFGVEHPLSEAEAENSERAAAYELAKQQAKRKKAELVGDIPLPPKYATSDFQSASFWPLRGKLDVPKERFFSLPGCEKEGDATLVIGWAGMNHLQRAQAIASWYLDRKEREGWEADKLTPMLVAIDELIPWLKQWHNDIDLEFGERMGDYYEGFLLEELRQLNMSRDELLAWEPSVAPKKKPAAKKKKATAE